MGYFSLDCYNIFLEKEYFQIDLFILSNTFSDNNINSENN